jgi:hypothetical protein
MCWEVFLDEASLEKFRDEQREVHRKRLHDEGLAGYVDERDGKRLVLTLFRETGDLAGQLKAGRKVSVAAGGVDRKPTMKPVEGVVDAVKPAGGGLNQVRLTLSAEAPEELKVTALLRLWIAENP